ncbi:DegV family protein [Haloactinomyces albus]|uniref:DegV family protein with EDD domain n=1 Tax=Haloactinomyces albus TaxID=1352928 RepID=A0AAE3ZA07_9ACTN|nr:DegV family protein [Haloactinomyces albus]MDR7301086.1 DegV family protein with EDD domain [Haloactinomyces albus]
MRRRVAIVTDSTASVPTGIAEKLGITVIQLELKVGEEYNDERRVPHSQLAQAMRDGVPVATAPPPPPAFFWNYMDAVSAGAEAIISVHLSEGLSRTCEAARIAATEVDVPVHVVDSRLCGLGLGYPVIAAAESAAAGATVQDVLGVLDRRLRGTTEFLYVDTLEYLRRSGRIGRAQAMLGQTLAVKPVLGFREGELAPLTKGIGTERALGKAITAAVERAGGGSVDIATEHFQAAERAGQVLHQLQDRLPGARQPILEETSAIIGAHTGPGALGITVSPV